MIRTRFLPILATVCAAVLLALVGAPRGTAAPIPKDAGKNDPTPDLKAMFEVVQNAVKNKTWPKEDEEKLLIGSARVTFDRAHRAAKLKERALPVEFAKLKKLEPVVELKKKDLDGAFVIARDVRELSARNSVIFASGTVDLLSANDCVIFAPNVQCVAVENCLVVAGESLTVTSAWRPFSEYGSVLVAGRWIRATSMDDTVCHVLRPSGAPAPGEPTDLGPAEIVRYTAIRTNSAKGVTFLNAKEDAAMEKAKDCTYLPQKNPLAK